MRNRLVRRYLQGPIAAAFVAALLAFCVPVLAADVIELTPDAIQNAKGDGPDGKGNTADDTWRCWFSIAHAPATYGCLKLHTLNMTPEQRKNGIRRRIWGPIGGDLPNPKDSEGWIYKSDWNGRIEGVWGDTKAKQVLIHPYAEKTFLGPVAVSCRVATAGIYAITVAATDAQVKPGGRHDGVRVRLDRVPGGGGKRGKRLAQSKPFGDSEDKSGNRITVKVESVKLAAGDLVRLAIVPGRDLATDLTRIDVFKIERVGE
jgi:hypothetical protein